MYVCILIWFCVAGRLHICTCTREKINVAFPFRPSREKILASSQFLSTFLTPTCSVDSCLFSIPFQIFDTLLNNSTLIILAKPNTILVGVYADAALIMGTWHSITAMQANLWIIRGWCKCRHQALSFPPHHFIYLSYVHIHSLSFFLYVCDGGLMMIKCAGSSAPRVAFAAGSGQCRPAWPWERWDI